MELKYIKFTIWSVFSLEIGFYPKQGRCIMARKKTKQRKEVNNGPRSNSKSV